MSETRVVNLYREPHEVYIGRGKHGIWGNPYTEGKHGTRAEVIEKFEEHLLRSPNLLAKVRSLRGMTLGCFCKPKACHGDVLKKYADMSETEWQKVLLASGESHYEGEST